MSTLFTVAFGTLLASLVPFAFLAILTYIIHKKLGRIESELETANSHLRKIQDNTEFVAASHASRD